MTDRAADLLARIQSDGLTAIEQLIAERSSENMFLEFKTSADGGTGKYLHSHDRNHLAKAISGFGNSEGGLVIWGIDCSSDDRSCDLASSSRPIEDPTRFSSLLNGAISGLTVPAHSGVRNYVIKEGANSGYVVTEIPGSEVAPLQALYDNKYYMRAGSSFQPVPHAVLAGMFGRRPSPRLTCLISADTVSRQVREVNGDRRENAVLAAIVEMHNDGRAIAENLFVVVTRREEPGPRSEISVWAEKERWSLIPEPLYTAIADDGLRLPPSAAVRCLRFHFLLTPPFERPLRLSGNAGAMGCPPAQFDITVQPSVLNEVHSFVWSLSSTSRIEQPHAGRVIRALLGCN